LNPAAFSIMQKT